MAEDVLEKLRNINGVSEDLQKKILEMVQKYRQLDEEGKKDFNEEARDAFRKSLSQISRDLVKNSTLAMLYQSHALIIIAALVIVFIFVFFGYKLYRSLSERERKREEKKRNKQMKKKK
ncbi:uncharacterized protein LOC105702478 isoform X2 [Orussus abietinus]|uniref:uncharacterized protein LOC105702478 isoform X2 n=1 Tax=Orussus abietinus TaxID=222816 RepID=UPI000625ACCA|nr:uncharacterized protein LOC105702478 isoform X2 [Orussus abietinus]